jgi:hypothetical protein
MKQVRLPALFSIPLRIAICALVFAGLQQSLTAREADGGHLIVKRSPTLGHNVAVTITIDGKLAGTLTRGRTFETPLAPGKHMLTASPGRGRKPWHGTLEARAGQTYTYTASYNVNELALTPATASR